MISKLFREKLKPLIFGHIGLYPKDFVTEFKNNIFSEYFKYEGYGEKNYTISSEVKNFRVDNGLKGLDLTLTGIKQYAKKFDIGHVNKAGYFLLPSLLNSFCNLTELKLTNCYIPYMEFIKLEKYSANIRQIELYGVLLTKLSTESISFDDFVLPPKLCYLSISYCDMADSDLITNPYEFLFNDSTRFSVSNFIFPKVKVRSLLELVFFDNSMEDNGLKKFLDLNPNLESLKLNLFHSSMVDRFCSLKRLEINSVASFSDSAHITPLKSINKLKIKMAHVNYLNDNRDLKTFCTKFPNLRELDLKLYISVSLQALTNEFLVEALCNLPKLKTLKLHIVQDFSRSFYSSINSNGNYDSEYTDGEEEILNITKFSNIENLYLKSNSDIILNTNFQECKSLKQIVFYASSETVNTEEFIQKFKGINNWDFKFKYSTIKGIKFSE
ncbi:hypothetical protein CONCODRAFT_80417 [Conidiobolus coronatus NRRL 28638]|uniref:RNI-like protein n=1 Tax=Conidiobolus coronatus (strain ATCC 28846 / CBS 209.66 / NRRL 28638) TaxID=796925 RepID=A0A137NVF1_CONC2|nr:hypothetical protein CONCODRAFT_80417 [Conidiobolus coronatus NRRL 28638]|eukprot:KXN66678.1 hypothetical protein CONCODRAFT_80417 [Conidiobolus coronatus NRRL 28638]